MSSTTLSDLSALEIEDDAAPAPRRRAAGWPLMGDIVAARGGVPEHIIQWRRAMDDSDPDPQL